MTAKREDVPYYKQTAYGPNSRGAPTEDRNIGHPPGEGGEPSAFDQAQEKGWEDLTRKGEVGQQPMWSDMGAHLNQLRQRAELAEDMAKSGANLKASGIPIANGDADKRRKSWPILDRINFLGGY